MPVEVQIISIIMGTAGSVGALSLFFWFKLKNKELESQRGDPELRPVVDALRDDLTEMQEHTQAQLAEMLERLDFAERLLTAGRASLDDEEDKRPQDSVT